MSQLKALSPTLQRIVNTYKEGYYIMGDESGHLGWYGAPTHTLIPLDERFHTSRSLAKVIRQGHFETRISSDVAGVIEGCADRVPTWITQELKLIYLSLAQAGIVHTFETWHAGRLAGGVLGLALGGAFIGESMFHYQTNASKVALVALVAHLRSQGFVLFDAQLMNPHLARFGAYDVKTPDYLPILHQTTRLKPSFTI